MKVKSTKKALLSAVLSLIVCISMLVGSTFAWFTDSVSSMNNIIKSGNLDVELYYMNSETTAWTEVGSATNVFMKDTLWEPGHTEVVKLKVVNAGSLALKYQLGVNIYSETESVNVNDQPFKLSDYIYFGVVEGDQTYTRTEAVDAVKATAATIANSYTKSSSIEAEGDDQIVTMVVYMPETVGNDANYKKGAAVPTINLGVNLYATQLASEEDSFGSDYDDSAIYYDTLATSPAEIAAAINSGKKTIAIDGTVTLTSSMNATGVTFVGMNDSAAIDFGTYGISGNGNIFKNLTLDNDRDGWYKGMQYSDAENTTYIDCVIANGVTTYGNSTFIGCDFSELPAGKYALFVYDGSNHVVEDCVFNYGDRAIKIYNEGHCPDIELTVSNTAFKASDTTAANKAMIEIDDSLMNSVKATVNDITVDSAIAAQGVYRINDGTLDTSTAKSVVTVDGVVATAEAANQTELNYAIASGTDVAIELAAGNYTLSTDRNVEKNLTITGTKETVIDASAFYNDKGTVTFDGVTIKVGLHSLGSDYAGIYVKDAKFTNCTFEGGLRVGRDGAVFENCTFNLGASDYVYNYGNTATFIDCVFNTQGKALISYSDGNGTVPNLVVKNCVFNATQEGHAGAISNLPCAAVEIDNYGCGVNLVLEGNTVGENFSGLWRIKAYYANGDAVTVNGTEYTSTALDGKLMTVTGTVATFN